MPVNKVKRNGSFAPLSAHAYKDDAIAAAGEQAELLYYRGLSFCADVLRDGFISDQQLVRFVGAGLKNVRRRADALARVVNGHGEPLWRRDDQAGGWWVSAWLRWNNSREQIYGQLRSDSERKPKSVGRSTGLESDGNPNGIGSDSDALPVGHRPESESSRTGGCGERAQADTRAAVRAAARSPHPLSTATATAKKPTQAASEAPSPRTRSRKRADELNATSRRADTQRLVNTWEDSRGTPLLADARRQWTRAVDAVLDEGVGQAEVAAALPALAARGLGPSLLASVIEEQRGKRASTPLHLRRPEDVTDAELTWQALDELLGEDSWMPPACPDEIDQGPPDQRRAWFAARGEERLAERRTEARLVLARNVAVST